MNLGLADHREDVEKRLAENVRAGFFQHGLRAPVEINEPPIRIERVKAVGDAVENLVGPALGRREFIAGARPFGDVEQGHEGARGPAPGAAFDARAAVDDPFEPGRACHPEFDPAIRAVLEKRGDERLEGRPGPPDGCASATCANPALKAPPSTGVSGA